MFEMLKNIEFNKTNVLIVITVLILLVAGYYAYYTYVVPKLDPSFVENKEFVQEKPSSQVELFFFFTEWCPHCKTAKPIWQQLTDEYSDKTINNTTIIFREIDCDKDEATASQFNVESYPTIKLVKGNDIIEYEAKPDYNTLVEFLHSSL